jgi:hypothetical protein
MKEITKQLLVGLLLLGAGLLSPSNGVDDKVDREPLQMLVETSAIILAAVSLFLMYRFLVTPKKGI